MKVRECLLIFGMHRSGTSAFAGLLKEIGIPMGKLKEASFDNPKGFYESKEAVAINERILSYFGQSWDSTIALPDNWMSIRQVIEIKSEIKTFLQKEFNSFDIFAIKDPRFSLTLPLWETVFSELNIKIKQYVLVRHPYEVANSLRKRNYLSQDKSIALWMKYLLSAEMNSRGEERNFISYNTILSDPVKVLSFLNIEHKLSETQLEKRIADFINPNLRHHQSEQPIHGFLLQSIYQKINALTLIDKREPSSLVFDDLRNSEEYKTILPKDPLIATLAIDYGNGFTEIAPIRIPVQLDTNQLVVTLPNKENRPPKRLQFYPCNTLVALQLKTWYVKGANDEDIKIKRVIKTPLLEEENIFIFNEEGFIEITLDIATTSATSFTIELEYLKFRKHAEEYIKKIGSRFKIWKDENQAAIDVINTKNNLKGNSRNIDWTEEKEMPKYTFWLNVLQTIVSSPARFFKQVNRENFRILKRALANESPAMILINLKKLLQNKDTETSLNTTNRKGFSDLPKESKSEVAQNKVDHSNHLLKDEDGNGKLGKLLYVFQDLPDYDRSSGGKRALRILELLLENFEVYAFSLGKKPAPYIATLTSKGIRVITTADYRKLQKRIPEFRAIVFSFYRTYHESKRLRKLYPKAKIIIDTIDLNWLREERSIGIWQGLTKERVAKNKLNEIAAYKDADVIWAVTKEDKAEDVLKKVISKYRKKRKNYDSIVEKVFYKGELVFNQKD